MSKNIKLNNNKMRFQLTMKKNKNKMLRNKCKKLWRYNTKNKSSMIILRKKKKSISKNLYLNNQNKMNKNPGKKR
jgi:hypothetical protein